MANNGASDPIDAAVPSSDGRPTCSSRQVSTERRVARAEFCSAVDRRTAAHGGSRVVGRALGLSPDRIDQLRDPEHDSALTFGDAIAAARKGAREWARGLGEDFLALVSDGAPIADVSPLRHGAWITSAAGRLLSMVDEALADDVLSTGELKAILAQVTDVESRVAHFRRLLEQRLGR